MEEEQQKHIKAQMVLQQVNILLQNDVNAHPMIKQTGTTQVPVPQQNADGTTRTIMKTVVSTSEVPNPKQDVIEANNAKMAQLAKQEQTWSEKKQSVLMAMNLWM